MDAAVDLLEVKARVDTPATHGYNANAVHGRPGIFNTHRQNRPPFTLGWADLMRVDHQVKFGLSVGNGPLFGAEVTVKAANPAVQKFVAEQWKKIWTQADKLLRDEHYGYLGYEVMYRYSDGQYEFDRLIDRHPGDTTPLTIRDKLVGVSFQNLQQAGQTNRRDLYGPQALWLKYDAEHGSLFGTAILEAAFAPWYEKTCEQGAIRMRQLRMIKDAWIGDQIYYDENYQFPSTTVDGPTYTAQQMAIELMENRHAGAAMALPARSDPATGKLIEILKYVPPTPVSGATQIMEWVHDLDWDIFDALLLPREVVEASQTGSGYSGRAVPQQAFLAIRNQRFGAKVRQIKEQLLVPLVAANFGADAADEFEIEPVPLEETAQKMEGQRGPAPGPGGGDPAQGQLQQLRLQRSLSSGGENGRNGQQFSAGGDQWRGEARDEEGKWTEGGSKKSRGHVGFQGDFEFYKSASGDLYRAPLSAEIDLDTGNRMGRWEAPPHMAEMRLAMLGVQRTEEFTLANAPTRKPPAKFQSSDRTKQRKLLDGLDSLPGQRDLFSVQFRAPDTAGSRWITIGGREEGGKKHVGGFPVQISSDGTILKSAGLQSIVGKKLSGLKRHFSALKKKREKEATSFDRADFEPEARKVNRESRVGSAIAEAAEHHGIDEGDLAEAVDYVWKEKRDAVQEHEAAKKHIREETGLTAGRIEAWERSGKDHTTWPGWDLSAREAANSYPELGLSAEADEIEVGEHLWEILKEGKREPPAKHDARLIDIAVGLVMSGRMDDEELEELERLQAVPFSEPGDDPPQAFRNRIRGRLSQLLD